MNNYNYIPIDLHCHSNYSDGSLSITELLDLAKTYGGKYLALTDHDTVSGISQAKNYAREIGLNLISGVEISVTLSNNQLVHILGLNVNENSSILNENLDNLRKLRVERGKKIALSLAKVGIKDAFDGAMKYCNNPNALSRTHFAKFLVANEYVREGHAFEKYLTPGKPGYISQEWASLKDAITWIKDSKGIAVIAHPARYKFTRTKLLKFIDEFKSYGGIGIEIISSSHSKDDEISYAKIANLTGLLGSVGSDFHSYIKSYKKVTLGLNHRLPIYCKSVFEILQIPNI